MGRASLSLWEAGFSQALRKDRRRKWFGSADFGDGGEDIQYWVFGMMVDYFVAGFIGVLGELPFCGGLFSFII